MERSTAGTKERSPVSHLVESSRPSLTTVSLRGCCEMLVVRVCGLRQNFYVYSLYRNPDQDDRIYDCLLT